MKSKQSMGEMFAAELARREADRRAATPPPMYTVGQRVEVRRGNDDPAWYQGTVTGAYDRPFRVVVHLDIGTTLHTAWADGVRRIATKAPAAASLAAEAEAIGRAFLNPPQAPPPCPFCTHALHTAHTVDVLRCEACGWAGSEEQRARASEPPRAESPFKVGDWVRARSSAVCADGRSVHRSVSMQVVDVRGDRVIAVWRSDPLRKEETLDVNAADLVATERPR